MGIDKKSYDELNQKLDKFLETIKSEDTCQGNECNVKTSEGLIERVDKKYITNDGRQLLM